MGTNLDTDIDIVYIIVYDGYRFRTKGEIEMKMKHGMRVKTNCVIPFWRDSQINLDDAPVTALKDWKAIPKGATATIVENVHYNLWHKREVPIEFLNCATDENHKQRIVEAWESLNGSEYCTAHTAHIDQLIPEEAVIAFNMFAVEFDKYPETNDRYTCGISSGELPSYFDVIED